MFSASNKDAACLCTRSRVLAGTALRSSGMSIAWSSSACQSARIGRLFAYVSLGSCRFIWSTYQRPARGCNFRGVTFRRRLAVISATSWLVCSSTTKSSSSTSAATITAASTSPSCCSSPKSWSSVPSLIEAAHLSRQKRMLISRTLMSRLFCNCSTELSPRKKWTLQLQENLKQYNTSTAACIDQDYSSVTR